VKLPKVKVVPEYTRFKGGMDLESPALSIAPGALLAGMNYVAGTDGGYERIDGYERFSGQTAPSDATYHYCSCTFSNGGPDVGDTVTGVTSSKTGVVITVGSNYINITKRSGTFSATEVFNVGATAKGTFTAAHAEKGETTSLLHATALNAAADVYRVDIAAPTGSSVGAGKGGLALLNGVLYAFLDNTAGDAGLIFKQSTSGWTGIALQYEISFTTGVGVIADGAAITQLTSTAAATVARVVLKSGTWAAGNAAGKLIINTIAGTFDATHAIQVGGVTKCTASSLATAITISPGGRYEFVVYNFTGSTATKRIYGCDGKNRGFEFDGTVYVPIDTGMTADTPERVSAFKKQLFFSFKGSSQNSGIGTPYVWSALTGATEIAIGDDITGYSVEAKTLLIASRNSTHQLSGNNVTDFVLDPLEGGTGAIPNTIQKVGTTYCLDDRGLIQITRVQEYGNFNLGTVSRRIQSKINDMRAVAIASSIYNAKNQYRLYGSDGTGICVTVGADNNGITHSFTLFKYPVNVVCAVSGEDSTGKDVVFFMSDAGMIYQADKGSSFDGEAIEAYVWLPFNNSKSPSVLKTYRKATIEMTSIGYASLRFNVEFNYGDTDIESHLTENVTLSGVGGYWDLADWDEFYWDSKVVANPSFSLSGDGYNASLIIYSNTDLDLGHKLDGAIIHYTPRRLVR
jgi:hypothetical protein